MADIVTRQQIQGKLAHFYIYSTIYTSHIKLCICPTLAANTMHSAWLGAWLGACVDDQVVGMYE